MEHPGVFIARVAAPLISPLFLILQLDFYRAAFFDGFVPKCLYLNFSVPDLEPRCHPVSVRNGVFPDSVPRSPRAPSPASYKSLDSSPSVFSHVN